jgi:hypothetical protein
MTSSTPNVLVRYAGGGAGIVSGSGSPGQIAFWSGSSILSGDNNLFWDNTNKRLGIGTTTPQTSLHVIGDITANTFLGTINAANVSSGQFGANTGRGDYSFPGNVGIGTTAPQTKLHIFENVSHDALLIDTSGWPIRRIIQKGGVIVEGFIPYDPNPLLGWGNKVMRIIKPTIDLLNFDILGRTTQWAARVYGCIYVPTSGTYTFYLTTDDGARFWVNWQILVDQWRDQAPTTYSANYTFSTPGWYPIRIDHYNNASGERLLLEWSGPGITRQTVPSSNLGVCWPDLF